ncbi:hypothetical protein K4L44_04935 [Halosquirtibacter laminarini]|uniref:Uncharacterized protein n=1 Tax=Halosquirtibacter laminarini TaxID=3374600 RepID=A0AC61NLW7_9BACT|nr:hypothetical protein K4L44_04935 [Prolixibacteraceae bacterium]
MTLEEMVKIVFETSQGADYPKDIQQLIGAINIYCNPPLKRDGKAIYTIVRIAYEYYMERGQRDCAMSIVHSFPSEAYLWKMQ